MTPICEKICKKCDRKEKKIKKRSTKGGMGFHSVPPELVGGHISQRFSARDRNWLYLKKMKVQVITGLGEPRL